MDVRKKLVELIESARYWGNNTSEEIADCLITSNVTVQEWISVYDRLPEKDGEYLVWLGNSAVKQHTEILSFAKDGDTVDEYDLHNEKNVWFYDDFECGYLVCHDVTHWMQIPQQPKGE